MREAIVNGFLVMLGAAVSMMLWTSVIAPVLVRAVGVPMAIGFWRQDRKNRHLNKPQYVWAYGAFGFGLGVFFFLTVWDYLKWKLLADQFSHFNSRQLIVRLAISLSVGLVVGLIRPRDGEDNSKENADQ